MSYSVINSEIYLRHTIVPIRSFDQVKLNFKHPLVICDIDDTLLYHNRVKRTMNNVHYSGYCSLFSSSIGPSMVYEDEEFIRPTDFEGFRRLEKRVCELRGRIIFLTARSVRTSFITKDDFSRIGLDASKYEIHYTGNTISKGQYIKNYIDCRGSSEIIFVDDLYENHLSVFQLFPMSLFYLFDSNRLS